MPNSHPIVLYDGVCGLCNRLVQFILKRDPGDRFRFAALQSGLAREILHRHGHSPDTLDTVCVVLDAGLSAERVLTRNDAVIAVLNELGGIWRSCAIVFPLFPRKFRDWQYNLVASNRYRFFGKYETCPLPDANMRHKFLDQP